MSKSDKGDSCKVCDGKGEMTCPACKGSGRAGEKKSADSCAACKGTGTITCPKCKGDGKG